MRHPRPAGRLPGLFLYIGAIALLAATGKLAAVSEEQMNEITRLPILSDDNLVTVDTYVSEKLTQMTLSPSSEQIDRQRDLLLSRRLSAATAASTWRLYRDRFAAAVQSNFLPTLDSAEKLEDEPLRNHARLSVIIVAASVESPALVPQMITLLNDESLLVRYWAAKALSADPVRQHFVAMGSEQAEIQSLIAGIKACLEKETSGPVIAQIAQCAALSNHPELLKLTETCLANRTADYVDWSVQQERYDVGLLETVLSVIGSQDLNDHLDMQRDLIYECGKLYTAAYERFSTSILNKDQDEVDLALRSDDTHSALQAVLIEGEQSFRKACSRVQSSPTNRARMFGVIEHRRWNGLQNAYELLLAENGTVNQVFVLYTEQRPYPYPALGDIPKTIVDRAINRRKVKNNLLTVN